MTNPAPFPATKLRLVPGRDRLYSPKQAESNSIRAEPDERKTANSQAPPLNELQKSAVAADSSLQCGILWPGMRSASAIDDGTWAEDGKGNVIAARQAYHNRMRRRQGVLDGCERRARVSDRDVLCDLCVLVVDCRPFRNFRGGCGCQRQRAEDKKHWCPGRAHDAVSKSHPDNRSPQV